MAKLSGFLRGGKASKALKDSRVAVPLHNGGKAVRYQFSEGGKTYNVLFDRTEPRGPYSVAFAEKGGRGLEPSEAGSLSQTRGVINNVRGALRNEMGRLDAPLSGFEFVGTSRSRNKLYNTMLEKEALPWGWKGRRDDERVKFVIKPDWKQRVVDPAAATAAAGAVLYPQDAEGAPKIPGLGGSSRGVSRGVHGDPLAPGGAGKSPPAGSLSWWNAPDNAKNAGRSVTTYSLNAKPKTEKFPGMQQFVDDIATGGDLKPDDKLKSVGGLLALGAGGAMAAGGEAEAMNIGPMARTWSKAAHEAALAMKRAGKTNKEIFDATGLFQDAGGNWGREISDAGMRLNYGYGRLGDLIRHPPLFEAYPELKTKFGKIDEDFSGGGSSWQADGQRFINNRMTGPLSPLHLKASKPASWENQTTRHSTAHELQHAVDDIEGRPYGVPGTGYHPEYKNSIGEVRARNTQRRADMTDEQLRASPPWTTEDVPYWSQILRPRPLLGATGAGYAASQALAPGEAEAAGFRRPKMPWDRALAGKPTDARMTPNQLLYDRPHGERATRILRKKDARIKAGQRAFGDMNETTRKAFNEMGEFDVPSTLDELDNRADRFAPLSHESLLDLERVGPVQESGALMREGRDWNAIGDRLTQPDFNVPRSRYNALPLALGAGAGLGAAATSGKAEARMYKRQAVPQRGAGLKATPRTVGGLLSDLLMGRPDPNSLGERTVAPALEQTGEKIGNSTIPGMRYLADAALRDPEFAPGYGAALLAPKVVGAAMQAGADVVHDPVAGLAFADGPLALLGTGVGVVRDLWRERPGRGQQELAWMRLQQMLDPKKRAPAR